MIRTAPFFGKGVAFPFRINPATGGVQVTEGNTDAVPVVVEQLPDRFSIRNAPNLQGNHIAEAIEHILMTYEGEHDTVPEFGSRLIYLISKPNDRLTEQEFETYAKTCVARWEHRAKIPVPQGVRWHTTDDDRDSGQAACEIRPEFIKTQVAGNLVSPFVSSREARSAEYPLGEMDAAGHDWCSRYHGSDIYERSGIRHIRLRKPKYIKPASDDVFYEVRHRDTWLLISHEVYGDVRFWWVIAEMAAQDAAQRGESRDALDNCGDPVAGELLRMPSRTRLLMELTA